MNNYVYIIAGLPDFTPDWRQGEKSLDEYFGQMRELMSEKDNETVDFIRRGFDKDQIGAEFYKAALSHRLGFIREFFRFDMDVRNRKVRYLNAALGRDIEKDVLSLRDPEAEETGLEPEEPEFKEEARLQSILEGSDILFASSRIKHLLSLSGVHLDSFIPDDFHGLLLILCAQCLGDNSLLRSGL